MKLYKIQTLKTDRAKWPEEVLAHPAIKALKRPESYPDWLKLHGNGVFWVDEFSAEHGGSLQVSTKERESIERAKTIGQKIIDDWKAGKLKRGRIARVVEKAKASPMAAPSLKLRSDFKSVALNVIARDEKRFKKEEIAAGTFEQTRIHCTNLIKYFGVTPVKEAAKEQSWEDFVDAFLADHEGQGLFNQWKFMLKVMTFALRRGLIDEKWDISEPSGEDTGRTITELEEKAILAAANQDLADQSVWARTMGCRNREIARQSFDIKACCHVNLEARTMSICPRHEKIRKGRTIRLSPQVYAMLIRRRATLQASPKYSSSRWVFPLKKDPTRFSFQNAKAWRQALERACLACVSADCKCEKPTRIDLSPRKEGGPGRLRFHHWRHTFLTECAKKERAGHMSRALICAYAGLSERTFEEVYLHLNEQDTAAVAELTTSAVVAEMPVFEGPATTRVKLGEEGVSDAYVH